MELSGGISINRMDSGLMAFHTDSNRRAAYGKGLFGKIKKKLKSRPNLNDKMVTKWHGKPGLGYSKEENYKKMNPEKPSLFPRSEENAVQK